MSITIETTENGFYVIFQYEQVRNEYFARAIDEAEWIADFYA